MCFPPVVKANEYFEWIDESAASHSQALPGQLVWSAVHILLRGEASVADDSEGGGGDLGEASESRAHCLLMDAPPTCSKSCPRDPRCPRPAGHRGRCKLKGNGSGPALAPAAAAGCTTTEEPFATELHESNKEVEVEVVVEEEEEDVAVEGVEEEVVEKELDPSIPAAARHVKELSDAAEERTPEVESGSQVATVQEITADPKPSSLIADTADAADAADAVVEEAGSCTTPGVGVAVGVSDAAEECEGRSQRKRKPVDYVSARVSSEISDEMERPQSLKKTCVLHDTKPTSTAGPEVVSVQARLLSPLAPISSGRLRIAPQRLDASPLVAPLHEKYGLAREESKRNESALDDGGSDGDGNGDGNGLWDDAVAKDPAPPAEDAAAALDGGARRIILQRPDCGEGRSQRKRKPVDYVSARVSSEISDEMERPQSLKKTCVLHDTKPTSPAGPEAASAQAAAPDTGYWTGVEAVADELVQDHPCFSVLVGSDVCVMAAAYPTDALSRRKAVGWRGIVTHTRGGASDPQVRVLGFWFRLADEIFLKPIKQLTQGEGGSSSE